MGCVAAVMLVAGGDDPAEALDGLQRITIISAAPLVLVMVLMCVALTQDLYRDPITLRKRLTESVVERSVRVGVDRHQGETFDIVTLANDPASHPQPGPPGSTHASAGVASRPDALPALAVVARVMAVTSTSLVDVEPVTRRVAATR